jgi:hypothetical protein
VAIPFTPEATAVGSIGDAQMVIKGEHLEKAEHLSLGLAKDHFATSTRQIGLGFEYRIDTLRVDERHLA